MQGQLGRDLWYPLDDVGVVFGDTGCPNVGLQVSHFGYFGDGIAIAGGSAAGGAGNHLARSIDRGAHWTDLGALIASYIMGVAVLGGGVAIATFMNGHVARTTDLGATWADLGDITGGSYLSTATNLGNGYAVACGGPDDIIYRSRDYGLTWTAVVTPAGGAAWMRNTLYLGNGVLLAVGDSSRFLRSINYGASWSNIAAQFPAVTGARYVCKLPNGGALIRSLEGDLWRTEDYGSTWWNQGPPIPGLGLGAVYGPVRYCGNGIVIASIDGLTRVCRSTDFGRTFVEIGALTGTTILATIFYLERGIVLIGTRPIKIWRSEPKYFIGGFNE